MPSSSCDKVKMNRKRTRTMQMRRTAKRVLAGAPGSAPTMMLMRSDTSIHWLVVARHHPFYKQQYMYYETVRLGGRDSICSRWPRCPSRGLSDSCRDKHVALVVPGNCLYPTSAYSIYCGVPALSIKHMCSSMMRRQQKKKRRKL